MMLQSYSSSTGELGRENIHNPIGRHILSSPCKLPTPHSPFNSTVLLGFNSCTHPSLNQAHHRLPFKTHQTIYKIVNLHSRKPIPKGTNISPGFKVQGYLKTLTLPPKTRNNGKKKSYGGVLPSILRSLESENDVEKTLDLYYGKLSPKEQTVILKEQTSWEKILMVFEWIKSQKEYVPNVIHYNVVLRALGRAQKWDELRLCWIEMAKNGVSPTNNTYGMLVDVYGKAGLVKEAILWIKHMKLRGIFPDEVTMNTAVRVLKDAEEYDRADKFYKDWCVGRIELDDLDLDSMADSQSRTDMKPVLKHFLSTELFKVGGRNTPSGLALVDTFDSITKPRLTATYNTLIDLYGKAGRLKEAADVFADMLNSGVAVDAITFNTMIFTCGSHGCLPEAEALLRKMEERGVSPDTKTYNIFLSLYADVGNIDAALKYYRKISKVGLVPDVVTHRSVLQILCKRKMVEEVEVVVKDMEKAGMRIDENSLPVVINMYVNEGLTERAEVLFEKSQMDGELSSKTCAAIIDVYADKGLWAEAEAVFYSKRDLVGRKKDVVEYNVMVKAYGKAKLYDKAFSLFKGMKNQGTWPDECTYNSLIQMFAGTDLVDQARDLLHEMQGAGFRPQCITFSAVVAGYARLSMLSDAAGIYQDMVKAGVKPNEVVYGSMINGFSESGKIEEALNYFHFMEESGVAANQIVLTSLIKAYRKIGSVQGAKGLYEKMKILEGGPDVVASNSMLNLYAYMGMVTEARLIFESLRERGCADGVTYATMMYVYKNMGMLDEAIDVAEEMRLSGLLRDCVSFNKVMACYATNGQLVECGELLSEMVNRKVLPDRGTFKVLFTVLKKGGIAGEAVRQLESAYQEGKPYARQAVIIAVHSVVGLHTLALESCEILPKTETGLGSFAFNVAIHAYGTSGRIDEALKIFMRMQDEGLEPDIVTYIHLVYCYGRAGMIEGVKRIHSQLKYGEIEPNESLFNAVIDAYRNANRHDLAELVNQEMRFAFDEQFPDSETEDEPDETSVGS